jgi:hypothetical protein
MDQILPVVKARAKFCVYIRLGIHHILDMDMLSHNCTALQSGEATVLLRRTTTTTTAGNMAKLYRGKGLRRLATCFIVYFALTGVCDLASGFSPSHSTPTLKLAWANEWQLSASTAPLDNEAGLSYGERSRPFRRDLFAYDDWVDHRRSDRFGGSLFSVFRSGVFQQLVKEIYLTSGIATFVCLYNALLVTGYDDFVGIHHDPLVQGLYVLAIPGLFFTVTSPALSLLLGMSHQSHENSMLKKFCSYTHCNFTM